MARVRITIEFDNEEDQTPEEVLAQLQRGSEHDGFDLQDLIDLAQDLNVTFKAEDVA